MLNNFVVAEDLPVLLIGLTWRSLTPFLFHRWFQHHGGQKPCGIFDLDQLDGMADFVRPALLGKVHASQGDDDLKALCEAALEDDTR